VNLPEQRTMIIDSKVPLASYERLILADDEEHRGICADQFAKSSDTLFLNQPLEFAPAK